MGRPTATSIQQAMASDSKHPWVSAVRALGSAQGTRLERQFGPKAKPVEVRRLALLNTEPPKRGQQPQSRSQRLLSGGPQPNESSGDAVTFLGG